MKFFPYCKQTYLFIVKNTFHRENIYTRHYKLNLNNKLLRFIFFIVYISSLSFIKELNKLGKMPRHARTIPNKF